MLGYVRIDVSEDIDANKTDGSREFIVCHYWYFLEINLQSMQRLSRYDTKSHEPQ